jgi:hypothetical protein
MARHYVAGIAGHCFRASGASSRQRDLRSSLPLDEDERELFMTI